LKASTRSVLADRLRDGGAPLGEIFSFISGLYFRGKLAYARAYAGPPPGIPGVVVITTSGGLVSPDRLITLEGLGADSAESRYRLPLEQAARLLRDHMGKRCEIVLLGSVATSKYVEPLLAIFAEKLTVPVEFVGRGDMSRGGLLLRRARDRVQLKYVPVAGTVRNGARPAKLPKLKRCDVLIGLAAKSGRQCADGSSDFCWRSRLGKDIASVSSKVTFASAWICCERGSGNSFSLPPACRADNRL